MCKVWHLCVGGNIHISRSGVAAHTYGVSHGTCTHTPRVHFNNWCGARKAAWESGTAALGAAGGECCVSGTHHGVWNLIIFHGWAMRGGAYPPGTVEGVTQGVTGLGPDQWSGTTHHGERDGRQFMAWGCEWLVSPHGGAAGTLRVEGGGDVPGSSAAGRQGWCCSGQRGWCTWCDGIWDEASHLSHRRIVRSLGVALHCDHSQHAAHHTGASGSELGSRRVVFFTTAGGSSA